jgi:hypothetical protein
MSKISLSGNPLGTGTFTIASPNSNTDRTLNLPDVSGTLVTTNDIPSPTIASTAEAEAGTNNTNFITPLRMREGFNASGSAPVYACRAWVNFDGTGTVAIRASGNVSSITDNGTGDYTVNFTTAMPDANYCATVGFGNDSGSSGTGCYISKVGTTRTTSAIRVHSARPDNNTFADSSDANVSIFR